MTLADYTSDWIDAYSGRTTKGFRDSTRAGYRFSILERAVPFFGTATLTSIEPQDIRGCVTHRF